MKIGEVKIRLVKAVMGMIDAYFGGNGLNEKFINSTLKILVKQNAYKVDSMLELFADQNGEIDATEIVAEYANMIEENGYVFDLKQYVENDMIKALMPDKVLVIKREDILKILV
ncbi:MAG: hypothetical protein J6J23_01365 [Clostridia bacterium]|nr:hypothetical protein [Clostridia bacterium]